jgi:hypothetical protein
LSTWSDEAGCNRHLWAAPFANFSGTGVGRITTCSFLVRHRRRKSNEPLVILDSLAEMKEALKQVERAAVEEARAQGATWVQVAEALHVTRQAVEQRFG